MGIENGERLEMEIFCCFYGKTGSVSNGVIMIGFEGKSRPLITPL